VVNLTDLTTLQNETAATGTINANNERIEREFGRVVYTDGSAALIGPLDINGQRLLNIGSPQDPTDAVRLIDLQEGLELGSFAVPALTGNAGRFLRTNGTTVFWDSVADIDVVTDYGVDTTGATNCGQKLQDAVNYAKAQDLPVVMLPDGDYKIDDIDYLDLPNGVHLVGASVGFQYYPGSPYSTAMGVRIFKTNSGTNGPLVQLNVGSGVNGIYFDHQKIGGATDGIIRFGPSAYSGVCFNAAITNCYVYGHAINEATTAHRDVGCVGIKMPDSDTSNAKQRYFNRINNVWVVNCDDGYRFGENCNANNISNIFTRQVYRPIVLWAESAGECYGNVFTGLSLDNLGTLPGSDTAYAFTLKNANLNVVVGFRSELYGYVFDMDTNSRQNVFIGTGNENGTGNFYQPNVYSRNFGWVNPYQTDFAALRAIKATSVIADGDTTFVRGATLDGDGGAGHFVFSYGTSAADDGVNIIKPNDISGGSPGRWVRLAHNTSAWNSNHLKLGNYSLWVDATGDLRIKNGAPSSDTDGTVVGTQS
jgi:hypothetical protein